MLAISGLVTAWFNPGFFTRLSRRSSVTLINDTPLDLHYHYAPLAALGASEKFSFLDEKWSQHTVRILPAPDPNASYTFTTGSSPSSSVMVEQRGNSFEISIGINQAEEIAAQLEHINRNYLLALYSYYQKPVLSDKNNLSLLDDITTLLFSNSDEPLYLIY